MVESVKQDEFFCRCFGVGDEDDSNVRRCDEVREIADFLLSKQYGSNLHSKLLHNLAIESYGGVKIMADQWAAVSVSYRGYRDKDEEEKTWMQCDDILDGLAGAYLWLLTQRLHAELADY